VIVEVIIKFLVFKSYRYYIKYYWLDNDIILIVSTSVSLSSNCTISQSLLSIQMLADNRSDVQLISIILNTLYAYSWFYFRLKRAVKAPNISVV
jgi:hypothetical protein